MMVVGLNELEFNVLRIEVRFDYFCGLIVHDIQLWFVTLGFYVFKVPLVSIKNASKIKPWDWSPKDGVCFVVVHYKKQMMPLRDM